MRYSTSLATIPDKDDYLVSAFISTPVSLNALLLNSNIFIPVEYALPLIEVIQRILQLIITVLIFRNERGYQYIFSIHSFFEKPEQILSVIFSPELHLFRHVCEQAVLLVI